MPRSRNDENAPPPKRRYRDWTDEDMQDALQAVNEEGKSIRWASRFFSVPKSTLTDHIRGRWNSDKYGRKTELTEEEETVLADYIKYMASINQPLSIQAVKAFAWVLVKKSNRPTRFNSKNGPGDAWYGKFKKRQGLTNRTADYIDRGRSRMGNEVSWCENTSKNCTNC